VDVAFVVRNVLVSMDLILDDTIPIRILITVHPPY
jgi:hypothetical protein